MTNLMYTKICAKIPKGKSVAVNQLIDWLIDWCLMPTLAIFQQYHGIRKLKKDKQYKDEKKKNNNDWLHRKLKIYQHEPHKKPGLNSGATER